jgi:hypothetical protein
MNYALVFLFGVCVGGLFAFQVFKAGVQQIFASARVTNLALDSIGRRALMKLELPGPHTKLVSWPLDGEAAEYAKMLDDSLRLGLDSAKQTLDILNRLDPPPTPPTQ